MVCVGWIVKKGSGFPLACPMIWRLGSDDVIDAMYRGSAVALVSSPTKGAGPSPGPKTARIVAVPFPEALLICTPMTIGDVGVESAAAGPVVKKKVSEVVVVLVVLYVTTRLGPVLLSVELFAVQVIAP
jgi:hypothetical protein